MNRAIMKEHLRRAREHAAQAEHRLQRQRELGTDLTRTSRVTFSRGSRFETSLVIEIGFMREIGASLSHQLTHSDYNLSPNFTDHSCRCLRVPR